MTDYTIGCNIRYKQKGDTEMTNYQDLVVRFNNNLNKIKRELASKDVANLYAKYNPEDDGHLAKILTLRGINL